LGYLKFIFCHKERPFQGRGRRNGVWDMLLPHARAFVTNARRFLSHTHAFVTNARRFLSHARAFVINARHSLNHAHAFVPNARHSLTHARAFLAHAPGYENNGHCSGIFPV
jgi:hypothetical protein